MDDQEIRKFLHDLSNQLNSANLNACLLKRLHAGSLDEDSFNRLDTALQTAAQMTKGLQERIERKT